MRTTVTVGVVVAVVVVAVAVLAAERIPHASDGRRYEDRIYRHLIFNQFDGWSGQSWVLPWTSPNFYIRLGGPDGCRGGDDRRVKWPVLYYWRSVIPVAAEQLTGEKYRGRVEAGCRDRPRRYGWVTVTYSTTEELRSDGMDPYDTWGAWALVGSTYGQIWFNVEYAWLGRLDYWHKSTITHEIGHAFGLYHTDGERAMNASGDRKLWKFPVFTATEEGAARRAYRAGRGARYCGNPDRCGSGFAPGYVPSIEHLEPPIAVD